MVDDIPAHRPALSRRQKWLVFGGIAGVLVAILAYVGLSFLGGQVTEVLKGTVEFGTGGNGCQVVGVTTSFKAGQDVHVVAHLNRDVHAGETVTLTALHEAAELDKGDIAIEEDANCLNATVPGTALPVGRIELRYTAGTETLAEGRFDVTPP